MNNMIIKKEWSEFRDTGFLCFVNLILHVFGWAIVLEIDENNNVISAYPSRVRFRGFDSKNISKTYINISEYMKENAEILLKESKE